MDMGNPAPNAKKGGEKGCRRYRRSGEDCPTQQELFSVGIKPKDSERPAATTLQMDALRQTGI